MCIEGSGMRGFAGAEVARIGVWLKGERPTLPVIPGRGEAARPESIGPRHAQSGRHATESSSAFAGMTNNAEAERCNDR
ncbi:hypothetical protein GCM10010987_31200 [Bradyrhizobium guangdongense]|uniref:Uncharacterized protein n=1 Tax=Bradyrhizobium guangdongense TaxID=1325090 RepID=A0AA88B8V6_9BRAD|nr:hypothetical protein GCM10010987_31200 [Bradyrhizobium guangdongense]